MTDPSGLWRESPIAATVPGSSIEGRPMKPFSTLWMDPALVSVPTSVVSMVLSPMTGGMKGGLREGTVLRENPLSGAPPDVIRITLLVPRANLRDVIHLVQTF